MAGVSAVRQGAFSNNQAKDLRFGSMISLRSVNPSDLPFVHRDPSLRAISCVLEFKLYMRGETNRCMPYLMRGPLNWPRWTAVCS